jgi:hypothetical protein
VEVDMIASVETLINKFRGLENQQFRLSPAEMVIEESKKLIGEKVDFNEGMPVGLIALFNKMYPLSGESELRSNMFLPKDNLYGTIMVGDKYIGWDDGVHKLGFENIGAAIERKMMILFKSDEGKVVYGFGLADNLPYLSILWQDYGSDDKISRRAILYCFDRDSRSPESWGVSYDFSNHETLNW